MARFRFSLQSVLDIKQKLETQAKQDFSEAQGRLLQEEEKLAAMEERLIQLRQEAVDLRKGILDFLEIEANQLSIEQQKVRIADQKMVIRKAQTAVERARERMRDAMMERKTYEVLREKAFQEYLQEENRAEGKAIDELTSYTYGQKGKN